MKSVVVLAIAAAVWILGCQKAPESKTNEPVTVAIETKSIKCEMCVKTISQALEKVDGVRKVQVDLGRKVVGVNYDPLRATLPALENAIAEAGYDANTIRRNDVAYRQLPECCK